MKYYVRLGLVLLMITAIASGILAYINSFTKPLIEENRNRQKEKARIEVLSEATKFDSIFTINNETVYCGKDKEGNIVGYTFIASMYGYSSDVKTMVGISSNYQINKIKIIDQKETPGLGANCINPDFQTQFNKLGSSEMMVDKDGGEIASITGATITSRAVTNSIKTGILSLKKRFEKSSTAKEVTK